MNYPDWLDERRTQRGNPYYNSTPEQARELFDKWERHNWESSLAAVADMQARHERMEASRCPTCDQPTASWGDPL